MNKNGQIFSVDFLISIMVVVLAIGLLLNFYELTVHAQTEQAVNDELRIAAEKASDLLVSNPEIICELYESSGAPSIPTTFIMYLPNCIPAGNSPKAITKEKLGLSDEYGCELSGVGVSILRKPGCEDDPVPSDRDIISVKRKIYVTAAPAQASNEKIKKDDYLKCINKEADCPIAGIDVTMKVWKA